MHYKEYLFSLYKNILQAFFGHVVNKEIIFKVFFYRHAKNIIKSYLTKYMYLIHIIKNSSDNFMLKNLNF